jgi:hypothetical protein
MISVPMMTRNCDVPVTAAGKPVEDATVNDVAPDEGDDVRVVAALSLSSSVAMDYTPE